MTSDELTPYEYFNNTFRLWWLVFLATLLGGALGFVFFHLHPPVYEATSTYFVTIDLTKFPLQAVKEDLIQYNEDMALSTTEGALLSSSVLQDLVSQLKTDGMSLTTMDLLQNYTVERKHDVWELRYRSTIPADAQTVVNTWAQIGYQAMLAWQSTGKAPAYVVFQPPSPATLPTQQVFYGRSNLMLAGALIGLIIGIIITARLSSTPMKSSSKS